MKNKLNREIIKDLHSKGMNDNEIARQIDASVNGVRYIRKNVLKLPHNKHTYSLTSSMESIIIGTLLGDAWVGYIHKGCKYPRYQCSHCEKQYTYLKTIQEKLLPIMTPTILEYPEKEVIIKGRKCIRHKSFSIYSRNCECLTPFYDAFYINNKKIIPIEFLKSKFTKESLAYWYMDDGSLDKSSNSYIINTQSFSRDDLQNLINFLQENFNLKFTIKKDKTLYLKHCCNSLFKNLISPYITQDMQYKLLSS